MTEFDTDNTPNFRQPTLKQGMPVMPCQTAKDGGSSRQLARGSTPSTPDGGMRPRQWRKESRHMSVLKFFRCTPEQNALIQSNADAAGMEQASYMRIQCVGKSKVRRYRRIRADWDELRKLMGVINRAGNVVNQVAKHLHMGDTFSNAANGALAEIEKACAAIVATLRKGQ